MIEGFILPRPDQHLRTDKGLLHQVPFFPHGLTVYGKRNGQSDEFVYHTEYCYAGAGGHMTIRTLVKTSYFPLKLILDRE